VGGDFVRQANTNIIVRSGVLEVYDVKKIVKGVDGLSISRYIVHSDRSASLHFHEFLFFRNI
jgi:hypothetical protein